MKTFGEIESTTTSRADHNQRMAYPLKSISNVVQAKLTVGSPNDKYEQEADNVADQVMRMPDPVTQLQRQCEGCEEEEPLQTKALIDGISPWIQKQEMEEEEDTIQAKGSQSSNQSTAPAWIQAAIQSSQGMGSPIPDNTRSFMESRFGTDFTKVRIHNNAHAAHLNNSLSAHAFTAGNDIYFNNGKYQPDNNSGKHLLAHELTHVVQQNKSKTKIARFNISDASKSVQRISWERDASSCTVTGTYDVGCSFMATTRDHWTPARMDAFRAGLKSAIETTFNANTYRIRATAARERTNIAQDALEYLGADYSCPCRPRGFHPQIVVNAREIPLTRRAGDWNVHVAANPERRFSRSSSPTRDTGRRFGNLDEADIVPRGDQTPVVHEFGHSIGLQHPGHRIQGLSEDEEYTHSGRDSRGRAVEGTVDLMGEGMGLRPFYFERWVDYLNESYDGCGFTII